MVEDGRPWAAIQKRTQGLKERLSPHLPLAAESLASAAIYSAGLASSQQLGLKLKVSCAVNPLASVLGALSVGCSAAAAGQVGGLVRRCVSNYQKDGLPRPRNGHRSKPGKLQQQLQVLRSTCDLVWQSQQAPQRDEILTHAVLGLVTYKVLVGARFRNLMPSDVCFPGAFRGSNEGVPARWRSGKDGKPESFRKEERDQVAKMFQKNGCHHCGRPPRLDETAVLDHNPPSSWIVKYGEPGSSVKFNVVTNCLSITRKGFEFLRKPSMRMSLEQQQSSLLSSTKAAIQGHLKRAHKLLPQCSDCCNKQGSAVAHNKLVLIPKATNKWLVNHAVGGALLGELGRCAASYIVALR